jgi:hypothetical protein
MIYARPMRGAVCLLIGLSLLRCDKQGASTGDCSTVVGAAFDRAMRASVGAAAKERGAPATPSAQAEIEEASSDGIASLAPMKAALIGACREDAWSADALACLRLASTGEAIDACQSKLTEAQRHHAQQLVAEASAKAVKTGTPECQRYADLEIRCGKGVDSDRPLILQFCAKARAGSADATYKLIALESNCAQTAADCDAYKACVAQAKAANGPY